ncbi:permease [Clostridium sp.]|uniref:permease n=1 Tax=Clostridium sp. TaxID=1506 RepID=UPI00258C46A4|nr:permease [Clostridium sp.]MDF2505729.1 permease [Clostridium sp.]
MLERRESRGTDTAILIILMPIIFLLLLILFSLKSQLSLILQNELLQSFTTIFLSIILEAIPFIIIGVFISSLIQVFISEETIAKIIPKNKVVGIFIAGIVGIVFPVCDCAIVPIVRRLLKKGMPMYIGVTFMLSVPIINPVVLVSTYYAFLNSSHMVLLRGGIGAFSAMLIGFIVSKLEPAENVKINRRVTRQNLCNRWIYTLNKSNKKLQSHYYSVDETYDRYDDDAQCSCGRNHKRRPGEKVTFTGSMVEILDHTSAELKDVGKFVIAGAFLSSLMQVALPRKYMLTIGNNSVTSILVMIALAFLLSVCSETDAFIARTFVGQFTSGSIMAFLIFGPMVDIKNTLMMTQAFKPKFIIKLIALIFIICFTIGIVINLIGLRL